MVRHVLGISGGKDSAALAIYLNDKYPELDIEYYTSDTGRELDETYALIDRLEARMGKTIKKLESVDLDNVANGNAFDYFLEVYGGYLPSSTSRWCTGKLKLEPFEKYIGDQPTISYVGIRGDEDRDGYISKKQTVQSIFPFRKNIWSEDVNKHVLSNTNLEEFLGELKKLDTIISQERFMNFAEQKLSPSYNMKQKLKALIDIDVKAYNKVVFQMLKRTEYPVGKLDYFPLVDNDENLVIDDIFQILEDSGVGIPAYYNAREYKVVIDGEEKTGTYARSRSGCFFCFYQQKIEWVWLYENHRELFDEAMTYEKDGYSWMDTETLEEISRPERIEKIKRDHYLKMHKAGRAKSWKDQILDADGEGCASCFI